MDTTPDREQPVEPSADVQKEATAEGLATSVGLEFTSPDLFPAGRPALADHNRRALARATANTALGEFQANMLRILDEYEEARRTEILARGGDPDEDRDPFEVVRQIADSYEALNDADETTEEIVLNDLADSLSLADIRALRLAGEAATSITPRAIMDELGRKKIPQIAAELGLTTSRVYTIVREERRARAQEWIMAGVNADRLVGNDPRAALDRYETALAGVPEEHREAAEQFLNGLRAAVAEVKGTPPHDSQ
ncbi:hypothetical protein [Streptomyces sp. NPDC088707]|uniref:hypothetical protein n=1 Tax=Streptomyces sp. NPDC088707 TaxID=3365871 RepID=UPI00380FACE5